MPKGTYTSSAAYAIRFLSGASDVMKSPRTTGDSIVRTPKYNAVIAIMVDLDSTMVYINFSVQQKCKAWQTMCSTLKHFMYFILVYYNSCGYCGSRKFIR